MIMAVPACISMISCKVSDPVYSEGGKDLIAYTSSLMIPLSLYEPAAVTAAAAAMPTPIPLIIPIVSRYICTNLQI